MRRIARHRPLTTVPIEHDHAKELDEMSRLLDQHPEVLPWVTEDLVPLGVALDNGRPGMTAEQVLRAVVLKQMNEFSYEELAFHLADSRTYRRFCRLGFAEAAPKKSCLQKNIKRLKVATLERINRALLGQAKVEAVERGREVRVDCTAVETDVHEPSDSEQSWDSVRVLARLLGQARDRFGVIFQDHSRVVKRSAFAIRTARKDKLRRKLYRKLLQATRSTVAAAELAIPMLEAAPCDTTDDAILAGVLRRELARYIPLARQVIDQTQRRVFQGETVPVADKVLSIFEPHTDMIIKGGRKTEFGHKICLTTGASGLVTDCVVLEGNPADSTLAITMVKRQVEIYGRAPNKAAFDGGFAAKENVVRIKQLGTRDVAFSKRRGIPVADMVRSSYVYKRLIKFRAGIEAGISFLKRCFGLTRCLWEGFASFKAYVWASVLSANLLTFARHRLAAAR